MKRIHILQRPTPVDEINNFAIEDNFFTDSLHDKASRTELRRWRRLKHQLV